MRESMGSSWVMQIMFGFTLLFVSFIAVTISYSKAYRIKNEVTSIIEKYGGYNSKSAQIINNYLKATGYNSTGRCRLPSGSAVNSKGITNLDRVDPQTYNDRTQYFYCIRRESSNGNIAISDVTYEVTTFYTFSVPIFGKIATFKVSGKTTDLIDPNKTTSRDHDCFDTYGC